MAITGELLLLGAQVWDVLFAVLIARAVLRAHRVSGATPLRRFGIGFGSLAVSQIAAFLLEARAYRAGNGAAVLATGAFDAFDVLFWAYYLLGLFGLASVFRSFGRHPFKWTPVLTGALLFAGPVLELASIVAHFFVVLHAGLNHIARARAGSLQTAAGFFLLLVGRFVFFLDYSPLTPRNAWGEVPTMLGFLVLYLAIQRPRVTA